MAVALRELLEQRLGVDEDAFRVALSEFVERTGPLVITQLRPRDYFGPAEVATLERLGLGLEPLAAGSLGPVAGLASAYGQLVADSLTVAGAAGLLDVDPTRVRQRIHARSLYAFKHHSSWLIPPFQIEGGRLLPGLGAVVAKLSAHLHPVAVTRWFTSPTDALDLDGEAVSPVAWLASGAPPAPVASLAGALDQE